MAGEEESNGFDVLGNFNSTKIRWDPSEVGFSTELRTYQEESVIVFTQRFQVSDAIVMWPTSCRGLELGEKVGMCPPNFLLVICSSPDRDILLVARVNPLVNF